MAPAKSRKDELKAKEARQKKILIALMVVLVAVAVIQVPKLMNHGSGVAAAPPPPTTLTTDTTAVGSAAPVSAAPPSLGAASAPTSAPASGASQLADTSVPPTARSGQLVQFGLFASKDPFVQQVKELGAGGSSSGSSSGGTAGSGTGTTATTPTGPAAGGPFGSTPTATTPSGAMTAVALISVNGASEPVPLDRDFPSAAPLFHLLSFTAAEARVTVAGGAYQDGRASLTLTKGVPVTLQNTVDGSEYRLVYLGAKTIPTADVPAPTATAPAATTTTTAAAPPAATTTATTTTAGS